MAGRLRPPSDDSRPHRRATDLRIPDDGAPPRAERDLHQQQAARAGRAVRRRDHVLMPFTKQP